MKRKPKHKIAAIVLAAGLSTRAGSKNKLLFNIAGKPMIARVAVQVVEAELDSVIVVTGHQRECVEETVGHLDLRCVHNFDYKEGMASSIRRGIGALDSSIEGVLICLGDMPWIQTFTLKKIVEAFHPEEGREICQPIYNGMLGNPVLFARRHFDKLMCLKGDRGGNSVIQKNRDVVLNINVDDLGVLRDLDRLTK